MSVPGFCQIPCLISFMSQTPLGWDSLRLLMTLTVGGVLVKYFCRMLLYWNLFFFLMIRLELWVLGIDLLFIKKNILKSRVALLLKAAVTL